MERCSDRKIDLNVAIPPSAEQDFSRGLYDKMLVPIVHRNIAILEIEDFVLRHYHGIGEISRCTFVRNKSLRTTVGGGG